LPDDAAWWLDDRTKRLIEHGLELEDEWTVTVATGAGIPSRLSRQKVTEAHLGLSCRSMVPLSRHPVTSERARQ